MSILNPVSPLSKGVPPGGTTGQTLIKTGPENYATGWKTLTATDVGALGLQGVYDNNLEVSVVEGVFVAGGAYEDNIIYLVIEPQSGQLSISTSETSFALNSLGIFVSGTIEFSNGTIRVPYPVNPPDAASKFYVDDAIEAAITGAMEASY